MLFICGLCLGVVVGCSGVCWAVCGLVFIVLLLSVVAL